MIEAEPEPIEEVEVVEQPAIMVETEPMVEPSQANAEELPAPVEEAAEGKHEPERVEESKSLKAANDHPPMRDLANEEEAAEAVRRMPDDPGVPPEEEKTASRFRLF
jgi:uncharacterized membrane-anchored protein